MDNNPWNQDKPRSGCMFTIVWTISSPSLPQRHVKDTRLLTLRGINPKFNLNWENWKGMINHDQPSHFGGIPFSTNPNVHGPMAWCAIHSTEHLVVVRTSLESREHRHVDALLAPGPRNYQGHSKSEWITPQFHICIICVWYIYQHTKYVPSFFPFKVPNIRGLATVNPNIFWPIPG